MSADQGAAIAKQDLQVVYEWVFMHTMDDLHARNVEPSFNGSRYHLLGIAPLLRKLLVDGTPLVHRANQIHRIPISFRIAPFTLSDLECQEILHREHPDSRATPISKIPYWRVFFPGALVPSAESEEPGLSLKDFLAAPVGVISGRRVSARELIKFYCIVEGGVHIGEPKSDLDKDLLRTVPFELAQNDHGIHQSPITVLHALSEIVLRSLAPLGAAIHSEPTQPIVNQGLRLTPLGGSPLGKDWWGGPDLNRES